MNSVKKMPTYALTYFPLRGRGEAIRYIFYQAGVPFEDKAIAFDEWSAVKPSKWWFKIVVK